MKPLHALFGAIPMAALLACSPSPEKNAAEPLPAPEASAGDEIAAGFPAHLQAIGTEPFWSVKVEGDVLAYTTPETMAAPRLLHATRSHDAQGLRLAGESGGAEFHLHVRRETCSDGMSDREYPFSATLLLDGKTARGCAFDQTSPPPPQ